MGVFWAVQVALEDLEQAFSSGSHNRSQFGPGVVAFTELNIKEAPMQDAVDSSTPSQPPTLSTPSRPSKELLMSGMC